MSESALFDVDPVAALEQPKIAVDKTFRPFEPDQILLLPPSLDEWLPDDHLARFVAEVVDNALDLSPIYADYTEPRGYPPYDPRLMVRLLVYGYTTGMRSSRGIQRRCADDVGFRCLAAGQTPDFRSIAKFPPPAPGCPGRAVFAEPAAGHPDGPGEDGPGGAGWHEAARERLPAQGDEL